MPMSFLPFACRWFPLHPQGMLSHQISANTDISVWHPESYRIPQVPSSKGLAGSLPEVLKQFHSGVGAADRLEGWRTMGSRSQDSDLVRIAASLSLWLMYMQETVSGPKLLNLRSKPETSCKGAAASSSCKYLSQQPSIEAVRFIISV